MLCELTVEGLGVIDHAELGFPGGLIALTGETGAGKTLIVAALGLLLGDRADRSLIRSAAPRALVEGRFSLDPDHPLAVALGESGYLDDSHEVVISRELFRDDRPARARINGRMATVAMLAEVGRSLVDVAGQHEHQRLGDASQRRALLDAFAGPRAQQIASDVRSLARAASAAEKRVLELRQGLANRERELDILRFEAEEIAKVDVKPGEIAELKHRAAIQESARVVAEATETATELLGGDGGAQERL
ncbi:MAG: AAA family ATPase, partial [Actinomycetota bacterium]|nr:AAA family ATPase [Actinomycetota bacterium]